MPAWLNGLRDLFVEAGPWRRLMLALLVLLPLAALAAAYLRFSAPAYQVLYAQLSDRAGGEIIAALEQLDIPYRLSPKDGSIEVPADRLHAARYRLAARGLPRTDDAAAEAAADVPGFGLTTSQAQHRQQRALEADLARSVQALEAVELARVHLALPKVSPFLRDAAPATAAVLVRLRAGAALGGEQVASIQTLVAASVPRLQRENVKVLDPHGVVLGGAVPEPAPSPQVAVEQDLARRALAVLTPWLGKDRVSVQVTATLDDSESTRTVERVRNVVVAGQARPLEKSVHTVRVPEGRLQRINAIVVLRYAAAAEDVRRTEEMTRQALGLVRQRGDSLGVFVLPPASLPETPQAAPEPRAVAPAAIPLVRPIEAPAASRFAVPSLAWLIGGGVALGLAGLALWRRRRAVPEAPAEDDLDTALAALRSEVLADPRVTADVVRLWMRA